MIAVKTKTKRAVIYGRTSGEDDTSLETQREETKAFIKRKGWKFIRQYEDECKSGAKVEGRDDFQRMIKDARNGEFDVIVVYDITRFGRSGADIIGTTTFLKKNFDIDTVDTKVFDSGDRNKVMSNYMMAAFAEQERLQIMSRMICGRMKKAEKGLPWCPNPPVGRIFDKEQGRWVITEDGRKLGELLKRHADGEPLAKLIRECGISSRETIHYSVRKGRLTGKYYAVFDSPDIGIVNEKLPVPGMPEIITPQLEKRLKDIFKYNKQQNRQYHTRQYLLSGFVKCAYCGRPLKPQTCKGHIVYYRHYYKPGDKKVCPYKGIQGDILEDKVLSYLYNFFFDKAAFNKAIEAALPKDDDRKLLEKDIRQTEKQITAEKREVANLVNAIAKGVDASLLIDKQDELKTAIQALVERLEELKQTLINMPDPESIRKHSVGIRAKLRARYKVSDWQTVPYNDVRQFLRFLFGDNPKGNGFGISVGSVNGKWRITAEGEMGFDLIPNKCNSLLQR